jgi:hypothetical protein
MGFRGQMWEGGGRWDQRVIQGQCFIHSTWGSCSSTDQLLHPQFFSTFHDIDLQALLYYSFLFGVMVLSEEI